MGLESVIRKHGAEACVGCGKCTYSCPVAHRYDSFSPRQVVEGILSGRNIDSDPGLWACVSCGACSDNCTNGVDFQAFVHEARTMVRAKNPPLQTHHGVIGRIMDLSSSRGLHPNTSGWVAPDLKLDERSPTLLFVGCTPYFDVVFRHFRPDLLELPRASVRLLNALGTEPRLLPSERCCGYDAYWLGDGERFEELARLNVEAVEAQGIEELVTFCPECLVTWRDLYPKVLGKLSFRVRSVVEIVGDAVENGKIGLSPNGGSFTYHDPCRLSKQSAVTKEPRAIIKSLGDLREMPRCGSSSACCGTAGWVNCDHTAKKLQMERLNEAEGTGVDVLVTSCPKCLIHLSCADAHHGAEMARRLAIEDIHVLASRALGRL